MHSNDIGSFLPLLLSSVGLLFLFDEFSSLRKDWVDDQNSERVHSGTLGTVSRPPLVFESYVVCFVFDIRLGLK